MAKPKAERTYDLVYFDQGTDGLGHSQSTISIAYGDGLGGFVKGPSIDLPNYITVIETGDFNGDGQTDVLDTAAGGLGISLSNGHGGYKFQDVLPAHATEGIVSLLSADVDGDGDLDAVYATTDLGSDGGHIFIATNDGSGEFGDPIQVPNDGSLDVSDLAAVDVDKDGDLDLYAVDPGKGFFLFKNDGTGSFTSFASGIVPGSLPVDIVLVDIDGDGKKEIASASGFEITFLTTGLIAGGYKSIDLADHDWAAAIAAGDVDGDGDQDLVSANNMYFHEDTSESGDASSVSIYTNDGQGNFTIKTIQLPEGSTPEHIQLVDLDGDGDLDILASDIEHTSMLINNGKGKFKVVDTPAQPEHGFIGVVTSQMNGTIEGTGKNESLKGTAAADLIDAKAGNDRITGGAGVDEMTGGAGDDRFIFTKLGDSAAGDRHDRIGDFKHNQDRLDFSALNPHTKSGKFDFIGEHKFDHHAGEVRFELVDEKGKANDHTIVEVDFDGNRKADMQIELHGLVHLDKGDFIL